MAKEERSILWEIVIVSLVVLGVCAIAYSGFDDYYNVRNQKNYSTTTLLHMTLQLFTLQFSMLDGAKDPALNWQIEVARFAAPLASSYAVIRAMMEIFAERLRAARVSLMSRHVVVCGLSRKGLELVKDFRSRRVPVVVVEWDKENDLLETCRGFGAYVVLGDATEELTLRKAGTTRARLLFAVCDEDGVNAEIGMLAQSLVMRESGKAPLEMYLHIESLKLCGLLRAHGIGERKSAGTRFRIFNIYENAARHVLKSHPLDGDGIRADDPRTVHLIIVGLGKMGETLALHAAENGHYANGKNLRLTIIDRHAKALSAQLLARHTYIAQACDVEFLNADYEDANALRVVEESARDEAQLLNVAVCLPDDALSLTCALRFAEILKTRGIPILVRLERDSGLAVLAEDPRMSAAARIRTFVVGGSFCSEHEIVEKDRARLARAIHEDLRAFAGVEQTVPHWNDLDEESRDFCRHAADHAPVKLRAIGCEIVSAKTAKADVEFAKDEIELLARMEHRRWLASRRLAGYRQGPTADGKRDPRQKVHPHLVAWEQLPESEREKQRGLTARIPGWLGMVGKGIRSRGTDEALEKNDK